MTPPGAAVMGDVELSVCIANWNCRDHLRRCLQSVAAASAGLTVETIVVDNASTDGAADMVASEFPEVSLHRNPTNAGFARASNQAARISRGRFLLFLNNDTVVEPDSLRLLVEFLRANPRVGMVGPKITGGDGRPQKSYRRRPTPGVLLHRLTLVRFTGLFRRAYRDYRRGGYEPDATRPVEVLLGAAVCLPRDVFVRHGGWDEGFPFGVEDVDLSARVSRTHTLMYYPAARVTHFGRTGSRLNSGFAKTGLECGHARYLRKHHLGPAGLLAYKLLVVANLPVALSRHTASWTWKRLRHGPAASPRTFHELTALCQFCLAGIGQFLRA